MDIPDRLSAPMAAGIRTFIRQHWSDIVAVAAIAFSTILLAHYGASRIDAAAFEPRNFDIYLQADLPRTYQQMVSRFASGVRTGLHPLYPLVVHTVTVVVRALFDISWLEAVRNAVALMAAGWGVCLFLCGRALGAGVLDSTLMTGVGLAGTSARFWLVVPETFLIGGVALLVVLFVAARAESHALSDKWYIASGVVTFGSTLTNWSTGILLAITTTNWHRFVRICLEVVGATTLLWIAEKLFFPNIVFVFDPLGVRQYLHPLSPSRIADVSRAFFSHAAVAPQLEACRNLNFTPTPFLLTFQGAAIASGGPLSVIATASWFGMLALGLYALVRLKRHRTTRLVLGGSLAFQYGLHLLYGGETFLYSIQWWGLLVTSVVLVFHTRAKSVVRLLSIAFIFTAGPHNWRTWESSLPAFRNGVSGYPVENRACDF